MKTRITILLALFLVSIGVSAQIDRSKQPKPGPAPKITLEVPGEFKLDNGLTVLVVENHKLPRVSYSLTIDNKPMLEGDIAGVSGLLGSMLGNGTATISKDDFNEEIDFLGASLNFSFGGGFARSLSKYSDRILELMADAAINPLLTEVEFNKEKDKLIEGLKSQEKSVDAVAGRVGSALAYGTHHPYGEFVTEESVNKVTFDNALAFYQKYFNPNNAYLVVVGDVDFNTIEKQIKKYFGSWKKTIDVDTPLAKPNANAQYTQINFVDMPNAVQSNISLTNNVDLKMSDDDYHSVLIANKILGGGFNSYLNMNLREAHGYTYGARSSVGSDKYISRFRAGASVRNAVTDSAVVQTLKEIKRIKTEPVELKALANAKAKYVGDFVLALENPQTIARYALNIKLNDLPSDFYSKYLEKINKVSTEDVQRVANTYFKDENARIVVIGKGSEVLENLEKTGIPIKYYDTYAKSVEKPNYDAPEGVDSKTILKNYLKAIGGKEKIDKLNSLVVKYEGSAMGSTIASEEKRIDGKMAQNVYMNGAPMMAVVVTTEDVFMKRGGAKNPLPENMAKDMKINTGLFIELNLLKSDVAKFSGVEKINGKDAYKIDIPGETVSYSLFYDKETGLKVKEIQTVNMGQKPQISEAIYKDYKDYEGILFAETKEGSQMGQTIVSKLVEVIINKGVTDADFD